jgi:pimeloyl-ACP methyl ester carboxylesterase
MRPTFPKGCLPLLVLLSGCAGLPKPVESRAPPCAARGVVFVVDGAGSSQIASHSIATVTDELCLPLHVRSFDWTHGRGLGLADVVDVDYARCQGQQLADEIRRYRWAYPTVPIYLVGFSAGSTVALTAAESLPTDTLERIVLLAPSVSAGYDLRAALASARQGVDVFTSERDRFYLGLGTAVLGTSDGKRQAAAGRVGFCPPALSAGETCLSGRLRQHPWDPSVAWTGNEGGHSGSLRAQYLRAYVLPLLTPAGVVGQKVSPLFSPL